jgi:hypothetical protein
MKGGDVDALTSLEKTLLKKKLAVKGQDQASGWKRDISVGFFIYACSVCPDD